MAPSGRRHWGTTSADVEGLDAPSPVLPDQTQCHGTHARTVLQDHRKLRDPVGRLAHAHAAYSDSGPW